MYRQLIIAVIAIALVVSVILILVAGRRDEAGAEHRTEARYLAALGYVVLFVALLASFEVVRSLMDLIVDRPRSNNVDYRAATQAGLVALTAAGIFVFHYRVRAQLATRGVFDMAAPNRVARAYFYTVCFTAVLLVLVSAPGAVYGIFRIAGPGVYGVGRSTVVRQVGVVDLVSFGYLALASLAIFWIALARGQQNEPATTPAV